MKRKTYLSLAVSKDLAVAIARSVEIDQTFREAVTSHMATMMDETMRGIREIPLSKCKEPLIVQQKRTILEYGELTDLFCPHCGRRGLMVESGDGDFYVGPTYWCKPPGCDKLFTMG